MRAEGWLLWERADLGGHLGDFGLYRKSQAKTTDPHKERILERTQVNEGGRSYFSPSVTRLLSPPPRALVLLFSRPGAPLAYSSLPTPMPCPWGSPWWPSCPAQSLGSFPRTRHHSASPQGRQASKAPCTVQLWAACCGGHKTHSPGVGLRAQPWVLTSFGPFLLLGKATLGFWGHLQPGHSFCKFTPKWNTQEGNTRGWWDIRLYSRNFVH